MPHLGWDARKSVYAVESRLTGAPTVRRSISGRLQRKPDPIAAQG
jgi:hypothetical protein